MNPTSLIWDPNMTYEVGDIVLYGDQMQVRTGHQADDWEVINPHEIDKDDEYRDTYEKMSDLLLDKGYPDMDTLLKIAKENNPELFI